MNMKPKSKSRNARQPFGQLVIGPPGSGKSTYSTALKHAFTQLGRPTILVNLDPANDHSSGSNYMDIDIDIDIAHLISLQDAMDEFGLGPNGALVYCLEYLAANLDWLHHQLNPYLESEQAHYFLFDLPGQVELFSHHSAIQSIIHHLTSRSSQINMRMTVVQLMDAHHLLSPSSTLSNYKYISAVLFVLQSMMHLELPQVNLLSKMDLAASQAHAYGHSLPMRLSAYTHPDDVNVLLPPSSPTSSPTSSPHASKLAKLNKELADLISDYALVEFLPFAVTDPMCLQAAIALVDKASGYAYGAIAGDVSVAALIDEVVEKYDSELPHTQSDREDEEFGSEGVSAQPGMDHLDQDMFDRWNRLQREVAVGKQGASGVASDVKVGVKDIVERLA